MKFGKLLFVFLFIIPMYSNAQNILYRVEYESRVSYLLGTIHSVHAEFEEVHPLLRSIIADSKIVVIESVGGYEEKLSGLKEKLRESIGENDLSNQLSEAAVRRVEAFVSGLDESERFFKLNWRRLNPGLVLLALKSTVEEIEEILIKRLEQKGEVKGLGYAYYGVFDDGLDMRIAKEAMKVGAYLDSLDGDSNYIRAFSNTVNVKNLEEFVMSEVPEVSAADLANSTSINELPKEWQSVYASAAADEEFEADRTLDSYYLNDDVGPVIDELERYADEAEFFLKPILIGRNETWAQKLDNVFKVGDALVAVGIAHLHQSTPYGRTLIEILEDRGFTVTAVKKPLVASNKALSCKEALGFY